MSTPTWMTLSRVPPSGKKWFFILSSNTWRKMKTLPSNSKHNRKTTKMKWMVYYLVFAPTLLGKHLLVDISDNVNQVFDLCALATEVCYCNIVTRSLFRVYQTMTFILLFSHHYIPSLYFQRTIMEKRYSSSSFVILLRWSMTTWNNFTILFQNRRIVHLLSSIITLKCFIWTENSMVFISQQKISMTLASFDLVSSSLSQYANNYKLVELYFNILIYHPPQTKSFTTGMWIRSQAFYH